MRPLNTMSFSDMEKDADARTLSGDIFEDCGNSMPSTLKILKSALKL